MQRAWFPMSDSRGSQPGLERARPELCHEPENGCQSLHPVAVSPPAMNKDLPQNDSLNQLENWLPATFTEAGEEEAAEALQKPGQPRQEDVEIFCSRSTESSSSGNEFSGLGSNGTSTQGLQLNSSSDQNPSDQRRSSSSNSSSEPLSWHQSHKKLMSVIREMKQFVPPEKSENSGKTSTLSTLNYAMKCVRQIQTDSDASRFFGKHGASRASAGIYSIEELATVTSEQTPKNTDTFVAVFSLLSGQMMHVSEQAASILNCKKKTLDSSRFVELLAPQDVGVFYTYINQSHLPLWNMKAQKASLYKYAQVKSFFCRIRGGKDQDQEKRYFPFRITPYLVSISTSDHSELEACCLALAEKIHSGYEAPRIPLEKRIFTTTHSPGCVFLEIDNRAVPLLGYLPQELIGTSILMHLHPDDRALMVAVHRKVLKFAGQPPFEHSPIRFCTQNGDYVILDTSWSSFMNPWSRKVVFIIGRHKVRTSPLNEDVFGARSRQMCGMDEEIRALQGQIYKLLLQPVHSNGSSGCGSLVSNEHEHYISVASSSDSNGNCVEEMQKEPMTLQQVFVDVNRLKNVGQQLYIESHSKPLNGIGRAARAELQGDKKDTASGLPCALRNGSGGVPPPASCSDLRNMHHILSYQQINCMDSIIRYLESCSFPALKRKCESSTNTSSSSSDNDKQGQQSENEMQTLEDASGLSSITSQPLVISKPEEAIEPQAPATVVGPPMTDLALTAKALSVVSVTSQCSYSSTIVHVPHPESEVTAIEEAPLQSESLELPPASAPCVAPEEIRLVGLTKVVLSAHTQKEEQNYVDSFRHKILLSPYRSYLQQGGTGSKQTPSQEQDVPSKENTPDSCKRNGKQGKWKRQKPLESSKSNSYLKDGGGSEHRAAVEQSSLAPGEGPGPGPSGMVFPLHPYSVPGFPLAPLGGDLALPSVAAAPVLPSSLPYCIQPTPAFPPPCGSNFMAMWLHTFPVCPLPPQSFFPAQHPCSSTSYPCTAMPPGPPSTMPSPTAADPVEPASLPSTPLSAEDEHQEASDGQPPLFSNSRSSSPLQLNLLQEELPKPPSDTQAETSAEIKCEEEGEDAGNHDDHSVSSEILDLLLLEDAQSRTGSAESGSGSAESRSFVSGSNSSSSYGMSGCATGSGNSSKYFASNDSSDFLKKEKEKRPGTDFQPARPAWRAAGCLPKNILMTYQVPRRIEENVLKEDLEKLTAMEDQQPWFTEEQKEELAEVHPWIRTGTVPQEISTQGCITCDSRNASHEAVLPVDGGIPEEDNEVLWPLLVPA
ncbi:period circadian protein homolog 3 isoform X2 [Tiliqua scincoides]|uniref:period circadian protein homolog 3 isoform X2 n=1 Tax=Tiliqua scincoides TaxID=71010 RepID=UPI003461BCBE